MSLSNEYKYKINKTIDLIIKNGNNYDDILKKKQLNNPDYSFLFYGPGNIYYNEELNKRGYYQVY